MAPLSRDEARAALVSAIAARPSAWVARELALTLARLEYRAGAAAVRRAMVDEAASKARWREYYRLEAAREVAREARA